jgi:acetoin utilization protein AcuB
MNTPTIDQLMTRAPYCLCPTNSIEQARALLDRHSIRHLPVIDDDEIVGVVVDRELAVLEAIPGVQPKGVTVATAMRPALSLSANVPLEEAVNLMLENEVDCVVVRNRDGSPEGIFTAVDALRAITDLSRATHGSATLPAARETHRTGYSR